MAVAQTNKKKKRRRKESLEHKARRIGVALAVFFAVLAADELGLPASLFGTTGAVYASFVLFLVPYAIAGHDVLQKAWGNIRHGKVFDENFLMAVATIGAFAMVLFPQTEPHMAEGAAVMLFYQVGEIFQAYAVGKSRKSIAAMMDIAPDFANVERDGGLAQVSPDEVAVGDVIMVKPGERVPIDGVILEGATQLDTAALTGESVPRHAESFSDHPIAASVRRAYGAQVDQTRVGDAAEESGHGVCARVDGREVLVGNAKLMAAHSVDAPACDVVGTILHVATDGRYLGHMVIADTVKDDAARAISDLHAAGVRRCVMLTGDREEVAAAVAAQLGLDEYHAQLLPADKVERVETLLADEEGHHKLAFVGDGINDAPVLTRADVGIAMGAMGSDAAIEAADVVLMDDKPSNIARAMRLARKTMGIVWQNIVFALAVKLLILVLAALGVANMWLAVFGDVGVAIIAILNAMRAMKV